MRRALAITGLVAILIGIPFGLFQTVGGPYLPSASLSGFVEALRGPEVPFGAIVDGIGVGAWALWSYLVLVLLLRAVAAVIVRQNPALGDRLIQASDRVTPPFLRRLVDFAVGGTLLLSSLGVGILSRTAGATAPPAQFHQVATIETLSAEIVPEARAYTVKPGDSLWRIAEHELGSGYRWREIFDLNNKRTFPDGRALTNPRLIHPGWTLHLPDSSEIHDEPPAIGDIALVAPPSRTAEASPEPSPRPTPSRVQEHSKAPPDLRLPRPIVELPSGSVIAASFASGLLAAQALSALRRRRSRRALEEPAAASESRLVLNLRRAVAYPSAGQIEAAALEVVSAWRSKFGRVPRIIAATETSDGADFDLSEEEQPHALINASTSRVKFVREESFVRAHVPRPFPPKLARDENPLLTGLLLPLGHLKGRASYLGLLGAGGFSIVGERAEAFAIQTVLSCAADTACEELEIYVLGDLERLEPLRKLHHMRGSANWKEAPTFLREIQSDLVARARGFMLQGVEDLWSHLAGDPDEYLPGLLIVATEPPTVLKGTVEAIASQASSLGGGLIAVDWVPQVSLTAELVRDSLRVRNGPSVLDHKMRSFRLEPEDAGQALEIINSARPRAWETESEIHEEADVSSYPALEDEMSSDGLEGNGRAEDLVVIPDPAIADTSLLTVRVSAGSEGAPLEARSFGNLVMYTRGREVVKGLRTVSRELLAYLTANPQGANKERILEDLWPDKTLSAAMKDFEWAMYHLRQRTGMGRHAVELFFENYRLNPHHWWTDVSAFISLIERSDSANDPRESMDLLGQAVGLYGGPFCDDCYFDWLGPYRDNFRSMAVKASAKLANLLMEFGDSDQALSVLDEAIKIDSINEDLYRRAIAMEGRLGRRDAVIKRFSVLEAVLQDELDVDPDDETAALVRKILGEREQEGRRVRAD